MLQDAEAGRRTDALLGLVRVFEEAHHG